MKKNYLKYFEKNESIFAWFLNIPSSIIILLVVVFPVFYSFYISLFDLNLRRTGVKRFIGIGNYLNHLTSLKFLVTLQRTFIFVFFDVLLVLVLALAISILLNQKFKGRGILRAAILIPWAIPSVVNGIMWKWILDSSYGILNAVLKGLGLIDQYIPFLSIPFSAFVFAIIASVWKELPFAIILLLAGLQSIPQELYEAARVDGATVWQQFKSITLPMISTTLMVVLIFQTMIALKVFDLIYVLTSGGPGDSTEVVGWLLYTEAFKFLKFGSGSAIGYIIAFITFLIVIIYYKFLNREIY
ncbi:MAG: sugar ABC transporter permease [Atribacterota bacterium]|nr:sugar ABC transporter permease [Atribacterota bacterium]MDD5637746.1 sugar ABC transporter permease [Atribacterota bacterium]